MVWSIRADRARTAPMPGSRRRRRQRAPWTGPSVDEIAQSFAESGRSRAVRHVVERENHNAFAIAYNHADLIGRPYWKLPITGKQYRYLLAGYLATRAQGYVDTMTGHLPKTGLHWWTDVLLVDGKWQAHLNVGHWTTQTDHG